MRLFLYLFIYFIKKLKRKRKTLNIPKYNLAEKLFSKSNIVVVIHLKRMSREGSPLNVEISINEPIIAVHKYTVRFIFGIQY